MTGLMDIPTATVAEARTSESLDLENLSPFDNEHLGRVLGDTHFIAFCMSKFGRKISEPMDGLTRVTIHVPVIKR